MYNGELRYSRSKMVNCDEFHLKFLKEELEFIVITGDPGTEKKFEHFFST